MALKSKWRIGGRKASNSSGENETTGTVTPDGSEGQELAKSPSRFLRTLTGGFRSNKPKKMTGSEPDEYAHLNRPFTQQNLEHQKVLGAFAWNFGKRKGSHGSQSNVSGISPSASRNASVDSNYLQSSHHDRRDTHTRFGSSLSHGATREMPGEESDREHSHGAVEVLPSAPQVN